MQPGSRVIFKELQRGRNTMARFFSIPASALGRQRSTHADTHANTHMQKRMQETLKRNSRLVTNVQTCE